MIESQPYKARIYSPTLGRFMQTDPIGYGDGMNMYAYVRNDPVNKVDPTGLTCWNEGKQELQFLTAEDCMKANNAWRMTAVGGEYDGQEIQLSFGPTSTSGGHYNTAGHWIPNAQPYQHPSGGTASYAMDAISMGLPTASGANGAQRGATRNGSSFCPAPGRVVTFGLAGTAALFAGIDLDGGIAIDLGSGRVDFYGSKSDWVVGADLSAGVQVGLWNSMEALSGEYRQLSIAGGPFDYSRTYDAGGNFAGRQFGFSLGTPLGFAVSKGKGLLAGVGGGC